MTDGGDSDLDAFDPDGGADGAIDNDWSKAEQDYRDQVADALADVETGLKAETVAIDLVTRQPLWVVDRVADTLAAYYEAEGFDLLTYKMHPWLPGIDADDTVFKCVYLDGNPQSAHKPGKTYDFPESRLMRVPLELATTEAEVGDV